EFHSLPLRKRRERRMGGAADEVDRAVAQRHVGPVDGKDQFDIDIEPFVPKQSELGGGNRREVRIRDHVGHGELHGDGSLEQSRGSVERQYTCKGAKMPVLFLATSRGPPAKITAASKTTRN